MGMVTELRPAKSVRQKVFLPVEDYGPDAWVWIEKLSAEGLLWLRRRFGGKGTTLDPMFVAHVIRLSLIDDAGKRLHPEPDAALPPEEADAARDAQAATITQAGAGEFQLISEAAIKLSRIVAHEVPEKNGPTGSS